MNHSYKITNKRNRRDLFDGRPPKLDRLHLKFHIRDITRLHAIDMIDLLTIRLRIHPNDAHFICQTIANIIQEQLSKGFPISIPGIGTFYTNEWQSKNRLKNLKHGHRFCYSNLGLDKKSYTKKGVRFKFSNKLKRLSFPYLKSLKEHTELCKKKLHQIRTCKPVDAIANHRVQRY